jgi:hypothetical protein
MSPLHFSSSINADMGVTFGAKIILLSCSTSKA